MGMSTPHVHIIVVIYCVQHTKNKTIEGLIIGLLTNIP